MIETVELAIKKSLNKETKLNEKALKLEGMSSFYVRNFLNCIVEQTKNPKYLEIGVWKGSTLYSALYKNEVEYAVAIDSWGHFGGPKQEFNANMSDIGVKFEFYNEDCFKIDKKKFKNKFNIYFYDGGHEGWEQELALTYYVECLEDKFLYICDDWNFAPVPAGTRQGIEKSNIKVEKEWILPSDFNGDTKNWWNGLYVAYCTKNK